MKTLLSFLLTGVAFSVALGQGISPGGEFYFSPTNPISYVYDKTGTTPAEVCTQPLAQHEVIRVLTVRDRRDDVTQTTEPAVTLDAAGQIVLGENALGAVWQTIQVTDSATYTTISEEGIGVPGGVSAGWYLFSMHMTETVPGEDGYVYCYLVALDTRKGTGECEGLPNHVARYAMTLCHYDSAKNYFPELPTRRKFLLNGTTGTASGYQTLNYPGYDLGWQSAAAITSLKITQEGEEVVLTGEALAAYLKPSLSGFTQTVDETGQPCCTLTATAPDVHYYTLYTKASLNDAEWTSFAHFIAANEKILDKTLGKQYTRFRIDGKSPLTIPVIEGENTRFYLLRGE